MKKNRRYRVVIEKVTTEKMVVEFDAGGIEQAAVVARRCTEQRRQRGITIAQPYDEDPRSDSYERVVDITEVKR